jgi:hypothetical protein
LQDFNHLHLSCVALSINYSWYIITEQRLQNKVPIERLPFAGVRGPTLEVPGLKAGEEEEPVDHDTVTINVGGTRHEVLRKTLQNLPPNARLANTSDMQRHYRYGRLLLSIFHHCTYNYNGKAFTVDGVSHYKWNISLLAPTLHPQKLQTSLHV